MVVTVCKSRVVRRADLVHTTPLRCGVETSREDVRVMKNLRIISVSEDAWYRWFDSSFIGTRRALLRTARTSFMERFGSRGASIPEVLEWLAEIETGGIWFPGFMQTLYTMFGHTSLHQMVEESRKPIDMTYEMLKCADETKANMWRDREYREMLRRVAQKLREE